MRSKINYTLIIGIVGFGLSGMLLLAAMVLYPNYNQFEQTISKLGNIWPSSIFFSLALLIEAITLCYMLFKLKEDALQLFPERKKALVIIFFLYILMICSLLGVVILPSKGATSDIHDVIAIILFLLMAIATLWVSSITKSGLQNWNKRISYLGYICTLSIIMLGLLLTFGELGPIIQKLTVVLFNSWVILTVYEFQKYSLSSS